MTENQERRCRHGYLATADDGADRCAEIQEQETREHDREGCRSNPCVDCTSRFRESPLGGEYLDSIG
jgi:hypothetical protein